MSLSHIWHASWPVLVALWFSIWMTTICYTEGLNIWHLIGRVIATLSIRFVAWHWTRITIRATMRHGILWNRYFLIIRFVILNCSNLLMLLRRTESPLWFWLPQWGSIHTGKQRPPQVDVAADATFFLTISCGSINWHIDLQLRILKNKHSITLA